MKRLFVEELESRHLLSVAGLGHALGYPSGPARTEPPSFPSFEHSDFDFRSRGQLGGGYRFAPGGDDLDFSGANSAPVGGTIVETFEIVVVVPQQTAVS